MANGAAETRGSVPPRARTVWVVAALVAIVTVDQLTKAWAVSALADGPKHVIGDFLVFDLSRNSGSVFSRFQGYTPILAVVAIVIAVFVARAVRQATDRATLVALVLVLGGALGNLGDRLVRYPGFLRGHVVDFVAVGWWPVFNVADSCITIGAVLLILRMLLGARARADGESMIDGPITVPAALDGDRVDRALSFLTGWPRAAVQDLIDSGAVLIDGRVVAKSHRLHEGTVLEVLAEPPLDSDARPEPDPAVPVDVRFADDDVVVVAKPAGLVVHPGAGHATGTLVNGLLARFAGMESVGDPARPGIVHRLDRDTSGLLVVARSQRAYESLVGQLAARTVERVYSALVWGRLSSPRGLIDAPIGRSGARRTRMAVRNEGKVARTEYKVVEAFEVPRCSLLECKLETGRTHQIRVHLSAIGHPVVGDGTYGGSRDQIPLSRPFLHAGTLGFDHPATGERLRFEAELPSELRAVLDRLIAENR